MHRSSFLLALLASLALGACNSAEKKNKKKLEEEEKNRRDFSKEPGFQAFLGRLQIAVAKKDHEMLQSLMTADFGYRWDNPPPGDSVFDYWSLNNLWPELAATLKTQFIPNGEYMVAPASLVIDPNFAGYRVGIKLVNGSWRFAYFVPPPPPGENL
jgi:hypothetical protein